MMIANLPPEPITVVHKIQRPQTNMQKLKAIDDKKLTLNQEQWQNVQDILANPPLPNQKMQALFDKGFRLVNQ